MVENNQQSSPGQSRSASDEDRRVAGVDRRESPATLTPLPSPSGRGDGGEGSAALRPQPHAESDHQRTAAEMQQKIEKKESRKLKARQEKHRSIWFGLGMFGMIGWSVAVSAVVGVGVGWWIDHHYPSRYSWTLMLLILGVVIGCVNAWNWVQKESRHD